MKALAHQLEAAVHTLESGGEGDLRGSVEQLLPLLRTLASVASAIDQERAEREALQDQLMAQRELIQMLGCPILRVRSDVLCVPLIGPYDIDRSTQLCEAVLRAVASTRARLIVVDLTGAVVPEPTAVNHLVDLCRAIELLGARAALSGIAPELAQMLAGGDTGLGRASVFSSLASALQGHT